MGLDYETTLDLPVGELLDLIACEQVKREGYRLRRRESEDDFWALMEVM